MSPGHTLVFETERLIVRSATVEDVDLFQALWTNPQVMQNVGFPQGLCMTRSELKKRLSKQGRSEFEQLLVVELKSNDQAIGECWLSYPDKEGIATQTSSCFRSFGGTSTASRLGVNWWPISSLTPTAMLFRQRPM